MKINLRVLLVMLAFSAIVAIWSFGWAIICLCGPKTKVPLAQTTLTSIKQISGEGVNA